MNDSKITDKEKDDDLWKLIESLSFQIETTKTISRGEIILAVTRGSVSMQSVPPQLSLIEGSLRRLKKKSSNYDPKWDVSRIRTSTRLITSSFKSIRADFSTLAALVSIACNLDNEELTSEDFLSRLVVKHR